MGKEHFFLQPYLDEPEPNKIDISIARTFKSANYCFSTISFPKGTKAK